VDFRLGQDIFGNIFTCQNIKLPEDRDKENIGRDVEKREKFKKENQASCL
jgi:hypothetical protein